MERCWLALTEFGFDQGYTRIELVGSADVDGKLAFALRFTPKLGDPQVRYFDCNSFLMVRMDLVQRMRHQRDGTESAYKVEAYYSDYRDFSGLNFSRKISSNASSIDLVLHLNDVRTNAPIDNSAFQKKYFQRLPWQREGGSEVCAAMRSDQSERVPETKAFDGDVTQILPAGRGS
jgi:hypothetical protein